jgi:hypothetical protein
MAKKMYVPNTIGIPTHGVDLWHHGLRLAKRNPKSPMKPPQEEGGKKERGGGKRGPKIYCRASHTEWAGVTESCHVKRRNSCMWLRPCCGYSATLEPSHTSVNGATEKSHIWKKSFGRFISRILFKKESKYQKKSFVCVQFYTQQYVLLPCLGPWDHYRKRHSFIGFFIFVGWPMNIRCHDHHIG